MIICKYADDESTLYYLIIVQYGILAQGSNFQKIDKGKLVLLIFLQQKTHRAGFFRECTVSNTQIRIFREEKVNLRCVYQIAQIKYLWPRKKCVYLIVTFIKHHMVNVSSILLGNIRPVSNHMVFSRHFWQLQHGTPVQGMFGWQFDTIGLNHPLEGIRRFLIECMRRLE